MARKGQVLSAEERQQDSEALKKKWKDPEFRKRMCEARIGHPVSEETKAKMSEIAKKDGRGIYPRTEEHKKHISEAISGENHPLFGKPVSKETKKKIREARAKQAPLSQESRNRIGEATKRHWQDPEYRAGVIKATLKASQVRPNKAEQFLIDFFQANSLPFKYVGDGEFILGGKCPDFLNTDGQKSLIELFGRYWHPESDVAIRINHFAAYGFSTLIIWEDELANTNRLLKKVKHFTRRT